MNLIYYSIILYHKIFRFCLKVKPKIEINTPRVFNEIVYKTNSNSIITSIF